ncbi:sel1 repeat family protein [Victivallis vadensis]|uniref:Sel1 repeat family protein n=1 Tax=Victivallis vadensis TaxID=172901 RepID=A0A848AYK3_9BACT|nr:tetratricopeptide repeat protein [Victivallis vadensis]NMD88615.1 sel1 repeat family protein [Victivallis vadensis]
MKRALLLPVLLIFFLSSGCRTYFGYEATITEEDIKNSSQLVSSKFKEYQIELDGSQIKAWEKYEDTYQKSVAVIEHRKHVYIENDPAFCLVALPFRVIGDILILAPISRDWHLATNPPDFFTRLTYVPPFSYFAFFRASPYWSVDPKTLKEGENIEQFSDGKEKIITKTLEKERVEVARKNVTFQVLRKKAITDGNIDVQLEGKSSKLDLSSSFITLKILNQEPYPARLINVIVSYKGHKVQLQLDSRELLSPNEQLQLGRKYFVDKNFDEALKWIQKAAEHGIPDAQVLSGICYTCGHGTAQDQKMAVHWFCKAAEQNHAHGAFLLGLSYMNGEGVEKNLQKGIRWIQKAAEQGYADAQLRLGIQYFSGEGIARNLESAIKWLQKAVDQDNFTAQYILGLLYMRGEGGDEDFSRGIKLIQRSAEQGCAPAQYELGTCYAEGNGIEKNLIQAQYWLELAATQNNMDAISRLKKLKKELEEELQWKKERERIEEEYSRFKNIRDPEIEMVKNGVFLFDQSRTVEEAFSAQLDNIRWRKFRAKGNRTIVEVIGTWNNDTYGEDKVKRNFASILAGIDFIWAFYPKKGEEIMAQFAINRTSESPFSLYRGEIRDRTGKIKIVNKCPAIADSSEQYLKKRGFLELMYGNEELRDGLDAIDNLMKDLKNIRRK